jgi:hypothetical protein
MTRDLRSYILLPSNSCRFSVHLSKSQSRWPLSGQLAISLRLYVLGSACRLGVEPRGVSLRGEVPIVLGEPPNH